MASGAPTSSLSYGIKDLIATPQDEMRKNLPREMDFVQEAKNAERAAEDFKDLRTSLYIPRNILVTKRVLVMEFIKGGRVDDLDYLSQQNIDRNKVAVELSRIFSRMVFINGCVLI